MGREEILFSSAWHERGPQKQKLDRLLPDTAEKTRIVVVWSQIPPGVKSALRLGVRGMSNEALNYTTILLDES